MHLNSALHRQRWSTSLFDPVLASTTTPSYSKRSSRLHILAKITSKNIATAIWPVAWLHSAQKGAASSCQHP
ncbi:hypothetical protein PM082_009286 [Marasmius tenuissimus]|nr:hypothetical protein PM082_009286 [Marasmius tenuissimus]